MRFNLVWCIALAMLTVPGLCAVAADRKKLNPGEVRQWVERGAIIVDVRTPGEYASGHMAGSTNIPVDQVASRISEVAPAKSTPLLLHCQSGRRSANALKVLREQGYTNAWDLGSFSNAQKLTKKKTQDR